MLNSLPQPVAHFREAGPRAYVPARPRPELGPLPIVTLAALVTSLAELWAYVTLGASTIVTEELSPIVGGVAASQGELAVNRVFAAVALGGWAATGLLYALGAWRGRWVRERWPRFRGPMLGALRVVRRRPWRSALAVRWAFGARVLLPIACGAAHVRLPLYLVATAVSSFTWSAVFVAVGYAFGDAAVSALAAVRRYDQWIAGAIALGGVVAWLVLRRRAVRRARVSMERQEPAP